MLTCWKRGRLLENVQLVGPNEHRCQCGETLALVRAGWIISSSLPGICSRTECKQCCLGRISEVITYVSDIFLKHSAIDFSMAPEPLSLVNIAGYLQDLRRVCGGLRTEQFESLLTTLLSRDQRQDTVRSNSSECPSSCHIQEVGSNEVELQQKPSASIFYPHQRKSEEDCAERSGISISFFD